MKNSAVIVFLSLIFSLPGFSKSMSHRLGVGPKSPFSIELPAIAMHYFPSDEFQITGAIGINTQQNNSMFGLQGGVRRILFDEKSLSFFVGGSLGIISQEVNSNNRSGFELMALAGCEFYFQGLENLGFNIETGVGVASLKNANKFYTIGNTPLHAGIIFYF